IDLRAANKKAFENLAFAGGFDCFKETHRAQYFHDEGDGITFLEKAIKYGNKHQENENSAQVSLFGEASDVQIAEPQIPPCEEWGTMEKLAREKEVVGIYISGHPLDDFRIEMQTFCNASLDLFSDLEKYVNRELTFGGVVTDVQHRVSKQGKGWALFTIEDYSSSYEFRIFGEEYLKFRHFLVRNSFVYVRVYVREGWENKETGKKSDPRLQFNSFMLLHDVMDTYAKKLSIHLDIKALHENTISKLESLLQVHTGNHALNFVIHDAEDEIKLLMPSRKQKVKISQELLNELKEQEVHYKLN
ncbi:MAG TPA: OB-fold nucleic acid binding domain-containing protein, partial [Flavobacteriaceae bacterium]|nr:OB-fold nucleic acid binding domain-containing protein [Flavobacteriaceae bacterium]